jgi:hypothetical protein
LEQVLKSTKQPLNFKLGRSENGADLSSDDGIDRTWELRSKTSHWLMQIASIHIDIT